ncbi:MAG: glycoside hydrolase family 172 protein, partial [Dehalococcoidia bacterium]
QEGRGFNSYVPMPFAGSIRLQYTNASDRPVDLYYQVDYTLQPLPAESGYLHVSFARQNPTTMLSDFVIAEGLQGPGRFLGCVVGIRVLDGGTWYGEGEVKVFRDGDTSHPTICGTGLEDYVGSAWGMGAHTAPYAGVPLDVRRERSPQPDFVSFYRWHIADPITYHHELRVTIQQIGYAFFRAGQESEFEAFAATHPAAGRGWDTSSPGIVARGICERVDDYCAAAFVYCSRPQPVPRLDLPGALADIARLDYEAPLPMERLFAP